MKLANVLHLYRVRMRARLLQECFAVVGIGIEAVRRALKADGLGTVERFDPGDSHHEAGGMAMGPDPAHAVTDPFGRSHSAPNVVVVDASTWPTTSAANPCLTITALAGRQAQQLDRDLAAL